MNTSTINFLLALRNASIIHKPYVSLNYNKFLHEITLVFYKEGIIQSFHIESQEKIIIKLKQNAFNTPFKDLKLISTGSTGLVLQYKDLCNISQRQNIHVFSTTKGLLTLDSCKKRCIGGKLLFIC